MPFIQLLIFGYVVSTDVRDIKVGLLDQSRTRESRLVRDAFEGSPIFRITHDVDDPRRIDELLLRRQVDIAVKIGPDFSERIRKGETAAVQVLADGSMSNLAGMRIAYTQQVLEKLNQELIRELVPERIEYGRIDARVRTWYNPNLESRDFFVPGIVAVLVMILSLLFTSMAIIKEKEVGTMEQLIVTPMRPLELILGKTIPYSLISIAQMVAVTLFAVFWFEIPMRGSVILMFLGVCLFLLSTLGIGLFISTISATQQQAMMTTFFFIVPFFMLSGFVFPIENMPPVVQGLTYLNPLRYMLVIIRGIFLKGVGMTVLWPQYLALVILGVIVFAGAVWRFRKRLD
jgi:ABC-2 type transport system permease protein